MRNEILLNSGVINEEEYLDLKKGKVVDSEDKRKNPLKKCNLYNKYQGRTVSTENQKKYDSAVDALKHAERKYNDYPSRLMKDKIKVIKKELDSLK